MAAHSSILAWEIPWTEEPDWHSSWGHKGVRHDLVTKQQQQQVLWQAFCNTHMHQITFHLISQSSKKLKNKQNLCISYTTANLVIFSFPSVLKYDHPQRLHAASFLCIPFHCHTYKPGKFHIKTINSLDFQSKIILK